MCYYGERVPKVVLILLLVVLVLLLDEEMVVIPKDYWKLDVVGEVLLFLLLSGYCGIISMMAE